MVHPIAGSGQYPYNVGGIKVTAAKLGGLRLVNDLYIYKQRSSVLYDLIDSDGVIYTYATLVYRNESKSVLDYNDDASKIADSLVDGTFCIREHNDEVSGFAIEYQIHKIKLHNGGVIYRNNKLPPTILISKIIPTKFDISLSDTIKFELVNLEDDENNGDWVYNTQIFDLVEESDKTITLKAKGITQSTTVAYTKSGRTSPIAESTGSVHTGSKPPLDSVTMSPAPENMTVGDEFTMNITFSPYDYPYTEGAWIVSDESVLVQTGSDKYSATFKCLLVGNATIKYELVNKPELSPVQLAEVTYDKLSNVKFTPDSVSSKAGETGTVSITYVPSTAQHGGTWSLPTDDIVVVDDEKSTSELMYYKSLQKGDITATFTPDSKFTGETLTVDFEIDYSSLQSVSLELESGEVVVGDEIHVKMFYTPNTAEHTGTWDLESSKEHLTLIENTPDRAKFMTLAAGENVPLIYKSAEFTAMITCNINHSKLSGLTLSPSTETVKIGDEFYVDIEYLPNTASHQGTWDVTKFKDFVELMDDSTPERAHFKAIAFTDGVDLVYTSSGMKATNTCKVDYSDINNVKLSPESESVKIGDDFYIDITYNPNTAEHIGSWNIDDFKDYVTLMDDSTPDRAHFKALSLIDTIDLVYTSSTASATNTCKVDYSDLISLTLTPENETVKAGDEFFVDITYVPETAQHFGTWNVDDFKEYATLMDDSTTDRAHFKALTKIDSVDLVYTSTDISATNICKVDYSDLTSLSLTPDTETVKAGDEFYIDIVYTPNTADHSGSWNIDDFKNYVTLMDDSTPDRAHFKALTKIDSVDLVYTSTGMKATNTCKVDYSDLISLSLTPDTETVKAGSEFYIDITYTPDTAEHSGSWNIDDFKEYVTLMDDSTPDRAHFKALVHVDSVDLVYSSSSASATNTCKVDYSDLITLTLTPENETVKAGDEFYIDIVYTPDTAEHVGSWNTSNFSDYVTLMDDSTPDRAHFKALVQVDSVDLIYTSTDISATNTCKVDYSDIISLILTPDTETVKAGDEFFVDITYVPETAQHIGTWNVDQFSKYVELMSDSTPDRAHFKALAYVDNVDLIYTSNDVSTENVCKIGHSDITALILTPDSETVKAGDEFYVDITYVPNTAEHDGVWDIQDFEDYVSILPDSTPDRAHFKALSHIDSIDLVYTSYGVSAKNTCKIDYSELLGIHLTPDSESVKIGDEFYIDIAYTPDTAEHTGSWYVSVFEDYVTLMDDSTPDRAHFKAIAYVDSVDLSYGKGIVGMTNTCKVDYSDLLGIDLSPDHENVKIGDEFYIDITYVPDTAEHSGSWDVSNFQDYVTLLPDSTPERGHFKAIAYVESVDLSYSKGVIGHINTCKVDYSTLEMITLSPSTESVKIGDEFYIDIAYTPDTAEHTGTWNNSDFSYFVELMDDSTPEKAHFKALAEIDSIDLTYSNGDVSATTTCEIDYSILTALELTPISESVTIGDEFYVDIVYTPNTAEHVGTWNEESFSEYVLLLPDSTPDKAHFRALKHVDSVSLVYSSSELNAKNTCTIDYKELVGIELDPIKETYKVDEDFFINITYKPEESEHTGTWNESSFSDYVELLSDSTPDKAHFKAKSVIDSVDLVYSNGAISATSVCTVEYQTLTSVEINPDKEIVKVGDEFYVDITYIPTHAEHTGTWNTADFEGFLMLMPDSTPDKAHFKALAKNENVKLIYTSSGIESLPNICEIDYPDLTSIEIDKSEVSGIVGDTFDVKLTFDPNDANHEVQWSFDSQYIEEMPSSDSDVYIFKIIKYSEEPLTLEVTGSNDIKASLKCNCVLPNVKITITDPPKDMHSGDVIVLAVTFDPSDYPYQEGKWSSDDPSIVEFRNANTASAWFNCLKPGSTIVRFTLDHDTTISSSVAVVVEYDDLKNIIFKPDSISGLRAGDVGTIDITYVPDTSLHGGTWKFEPEGNIIVSKNTPDEIQFIPMIAGKYTGTFTPNASYFSPKVIDMDIDYSILQYLSIVLKDQTAPIIVDADFYVQIAYSPYSAQHIGTWDLSGIEEYVELLDDSTPDLAHFKAKKTVDSIELLYNSADLTAKLNIKIEYPDVTDVSIDPKSIVVNAPTGATFNAKLTYTPDNAEHTGTWNTQEWGSSIKLVSNENDISTFVVAPNAPTSTINMVYTSGAVCDTMVCYLNRPPLVRIELGISDVVTYVDEDFYVRIDYFPGNSINEGFWNLEEIGDYVELLPDSTPISAHFKALSPIKDLKLVYTSSYNQHISASVECSIVDEPTIAITPNKDTITIHDFFTVDVSYAPRSLSQLGTWNVTDTSRYVTIYPAGVTEKRAGFRANEVTPSFELIYKCGDLQASTTFAINYQKLVGIALSPLETTTTVGEDFYIDIKYSPTDAEHKGEWDTSNFFSKVKLLDDSTPDRGHFKAINQTIGQDLTYKSGNSSMSVRCYIDYPKLSEIVLTPSAVEIPVNGEFYITIDYLPIGSEAVGAWDTSTFSEHVKLLPDSTPTKAHFKALKAINAIELVYRSGDVTATNECKITPPEVSDIVLNPSSVLVIVSDDFYIDIDFLPEGSEPSGGWVIDETLYVSLHSGDSTPTRSHFRALGVTPEGGMDLVYTSGDISRKVHYVIENKPVVESIKLTPSSETVKIGDEFYVDISYIPNNAMHSGLWHENDFKLYVELLPDSTYERAHFKVIGCPSGGSNTIDLVYSDFSNEVFATNKCTILNDKLEGITLNPTTQTVQIGDEFDIDITYIPNSAKHTGEWNVSEFSDYIEIMSDDKDRPKFKALVPVDDVKLTYSSEGFSSTCTCTIESPKITSIELSTSGGNVMVGDDVYIGVLFEPSNAKPSGTWNLDEISEYLELQDDSTLELAHFKAKHKVDGLNVTFSSGDVSATAVYNISYAKLESVSLSPAMNEVLVDDDFYVDIQYTPDNAEHTGSFNMTDYDSQVYLKLLPDSTPDRAHFYTKLVIPWTRTLIYNSADKKASTRYKITSVPPTGMTLDKTDITVNTGDEFIINIEYMPLHASPAGSWNVIPISEYVGLLSEFTTSRQSHFKAKKPTKDGSPIVMVFTNTDDVNITATCTCTIIDTEIEEISLTPESGTVKVGDDFYVDIQYYPDDVVHNGFWNTEDIKDYVTLMSDSTPDRAHFKAISDVENVKLIYGNGTIRADSTYTINK